MRLSPGPVQGVRQVDEGERSVDAFLGLPFAKPHVGELRFKKPHPPSPWTEVLRATEMPPSGMQPEVPMATWDTNLNFGQINLPKSEDSLYLNVFTPTWQSPNGDGFPVMLFVHGGGYVCGDSRMYGDEGICRHVVAKDVVVVTIQYRLGYLGFFSTGDSACSGNLGLWDQTEALKWTRDNIAAFGGNPNNVTVFGQCAGGASVDFLLLNPHSNGLFHKAIPMAGAADCSWAMNAKVAENCSAFAVKHGVTEKDSEKMLDELRRLPAEQFVAVLGLDTTTGILTFDTTPVIDGDFLPEAVAELRKKEAPHKPLLTGITKLESNFTISVMTQQPTVASLRSLIGRILPESLPDKEAAVDKLLKKEYGIVDEEAASDAGKIKRAYAEALSDEQFNVGFFRLIAEFTAAGWISPIYSYVFDHFNRDAHGPFMGTIDIEESSHATELPYLFGKSIFGGQPLEGADNLAELFSTAFTNFAKYGDPNGGGTTTSTLPLPLAWPPVASAASLETHFVFAREPCVDCQLYGGRLARITKYFDDD